MCRTSTLRSSGRLPQVSKSTNSGKLTLPLLKTLTNKFAPEIMFTVTLPDQGLTNLEALEECENLMVLNVAGNSITSMEPLKRMK